MDGAKRWRLAYRYNGRQKTLAIGVYPTTGLRDAREARDQARRLEGCLQSFARQAFGRAGPTQLRRAAFVLAEVPIAVVRPHLERREPPPALVDELITTTFHAIVGGGRGKSGEGAS